MVHKIVKNILGEDDDEDYGGPTVKDIKGKRVKREWHELRGY